MVDLPGEVERETGLSQTGRALLALREMLLQGELAPGERLVETTLVELLGVSRTPVRTALAKLESEGLIGPARGGGYVVRAFGERDLVDAIEIRGTIEGLAVRSLAERGLPSSRMARLRDLVARLGTIVQAAEMAPDAFSLYAEWNGRLHDALVEAAESPVLERHYQLAVALPFASPSGLVVAQALSPASRVLLQVAQDQHVCLLDAIAAREGARAEAIAREHARLAIRNLRIALQNPASRSRIPGSALMRQRS